LKVNVRRQLLVYDDDVNKRTLGRSLHTIKKAEALLVASKEIRLEVNAVKTG
jgi:hypothetical protein